MLNSQTRHPVGRLECAQQAKQAAATACRLITKPVKLVKLAAMSALQQSADAQSAGLTFSWKAANAQRDLAAARAGAEVQEEEAEMAKGELDEHERHSSC